MNLKYIALSVTVTLATAVITPMAHSAGIPTFDASNVAQAIAQVQNQVKQIENMRHQLQSATGNARLGILLNDPTVSKYLGKYTPQGISLKDLADGNYDRTLQQIAKRIENDLKQGNKPADPKAQVAQAQVMNMASLEHSMNTLSSLSKQSERIARQINSTTDLSSKADLANTLQAQSAQINIAIAQANLQLKQMELLEKRAREVEEKISYNKLLGR